MLNWPDAFALAAIASSLAFAYWVRKAYDKSPTLHIIRNETDEPEAYGYQSRDPEMILQTWREDEDG